MITRSHHNFFKSDYCSVNIIGKIFGNRGVLEGGWVSHVRSSKKFKLQTIFFIFIEFPMFILIFPLLESLACFLCEELGTSVVCHLCHSTPPRYPGMTSPFSFTRFSAPLWRAFLTRFVASLTQKSPDHSNAPWESGWYAHTSKRKFPRMFIELAW